LYGKGFIPIFIEKEEREAFDLELIGYKVILPTDEFDIAKVERFFAETITGNATVSTTRTGTHFEINYKMPAIEGSEVDHGFYYVWHLQANMKDKSHNPSTANWKMAFTLPIDLS